MDNKQLLKYFAALGVGAAAGKMLPDLPGFKDDTGSAQILKYLATFGAGAATGKIFSDLQQTKYDEATQYFRNLLEEAGITPDPVEVAHACKALATEKDEGTRRGAAAFLAIATTPPFRYLIAAPAVRRLVETAASVHQSESNDDTRRLLRYALEAVNKWTPTEEESILAQLHANLRILEAYVQATPQQRATEYKLSIEQSGLGQDHMVSFFHACNEEMACNGWDEKFKDFLLWYNGRPQNEQVLLIFLCVAIDSKGETRWLPGFFHQIEILRNQK